MCGVVGVTGIPFASWEVYQGLQTLQHRGQQGAGILSYDKNFGPNLIRAKGLVSNLDQQRPKDYPGDMAIGHTRYATVGNGDISELQPIMSRFPYGMGLAHNGNLVNYNELAKELSEDCQHALLGNTDSEVLLGLLTREITKVLNKKDIFEQLKFAVLEIFKKVKGGFACIGLVAGKGLFAFRDPFGLRPLVIGKKGNSYCISSESKTLQHLGYEFVKDVDAGERIYIRENKLISYQYSKSNLRPCMFEWVYFASPDGQLEGKSIYQSREELGKKLAEQIKNEEHDYDLVACVPETSRLAALTLAQELSLPYKELLIKNRYIHRSFIMKTQKDRERAVTLKWGPVKELIKNKRVLLVDDSIVRGTTAKRIVSVIRDLGAKSIGLASTCPPIKFPCFYGIDFPEKNELLSSTGDLQSWCDILKLDHLYYLKEENLFSVLNRGKDELCMACINGDYPYKAMSENDFLLRRIRDRNASILE